jgi:hypothetical protein
VLRLINRGLDSFLHKTGFSPGQPLCGCKTTQISFPENQTEQICLLSAALRPLMASGCPEIIKIII